MNYFRRTSPPAAGGSSGSKQRRRPKPNLNHFTNKFIPGVWLRLFHVEGRGKQTPEDKLVEAVSEECTGGDGRHMPIPNGECRLMLTSP